MERILAIDIGNTNITLGLFAAGRLKKTAKIPTGRAKYSANRIKRFCGGPVKTAVISSVVPNALKIIVPQIKRAFKCRVMIIGKEMKVPIRNLYRKKREVGQDRLVNAFAARMLYGTPAVIIDFGTAITFDIVSRKGDYLGGLILPGIEMSLEGLYERTALLPRVRLKREPNIIGKDTAGSIRGGILFGLGVMCDGLVSRYKRIIGKRAKVIATGGNAELVKKYSMSIKIVDADITLRGLYLIQNLR